MSKETRCVIVALMTFSIINVFAIIWAFIMPMSTSFATGTLFWGAIAAFVASALYY